MRGIVLEIKGDRCVVMKNDGSFENIRNRHYVVGQKIIFSRPSYIKYLSAVACLAFMCSALFGYYLYFTPTSYVYLDINPSIRIDVNRFERVIDVVPLNDDAETLLSSATISRKNPQACMNNIVSACQNQHYLNENNSDIEVSIRTDDKKLESTVQTASATIGNGELEVSIFQMNEEENENALRHHVSARRLRAVHAYTETFGGSLKENMNALQGISSDDIYETIAKHHRALQSERTAQAPSDAATNVPAVTKNDFSAPDDTPEPMQQSKRLKDNTASYPSSGSHSNSNHRLTAQRLAAIRAYTDAFGGSTEKNAALLKGISSDEIYQMIESFTTEGDTSDTP